MKQQISKEQWDELDDKLKLKFANSFSNIKYKIFTKQFDDYCKPTIGQMIEFLGDDLITMEKMSNWWLQGKGMVKNDVNFNLSIILLFIYL